MKTLKGSGRKGIIRKQLKLVHGKGVRGLNLTRSSNGKVLPSYRAWVAILERCYSEKWHKLKPTYRGCTVCDEWIYFDNFKIWFEQNYKKGYHLDKDILIQGNKVYSPKTCCYVSSTINSLLLDRRNDRGIYPQGVSKASGRSLQFSASISKYGKPFYLGNFKTIERASNAYNKEKYKYIRQVAGQSYISGIISSEVYKSLLNYKIL